MAQRVTTVEYAFPQRDTSLAAATRNDYSAITLTIPQTGTRTFRSVIIECQFHDNSATAVNLTSVLLGIKLAAVAFSNVTVTDTIANSGEHQSYIATRDVTSYFNTNFGSGTTQTCQVGVQIGGVATINISVKLIITYEWDDAHASASTRVRTVRIPIDSNTGALTATLAELGTNQIPNLDSFLPEASKTYTNIWFEIAGNEASTGTTNYQLGLQIDSATEVLDGSHQGALNSARWYKRIYVNNSLTTNAVHAFKLRTTSTSGGTFNHISVVLYVTYTYDHSSSTSIMNSVMLPIDSINILGGHTTTGDKTRITFPLWIEEPSTIALVQSGVQIHFSLPGTATVSIACGGQTARAYTSGVGGAICGGYTVSQRIDSGGAAGAGITIARGRNTFTIDWFGSSASNIPSAFSGWLILNYTSGKHASGDGVHNRTTFWQQADYAADAIERVITPTTIPNIPETSYFLNAVGVWHAIWALQINNYQMQYAMEYQASEGLGAGWSAIGSALINKSAENGVWQSVYEARDQFLRWPGDPDNSKRMDIEVSRSARLRQLPISYSMAYMVVTHHAITYAVTGALVDYASTGSGVTVNLHRSDTDEKILTTTTSSGGAYSFTWYDNTIVVYAVARQQSGKVGRSDNVTAA